MATLAIGERQSFRLVVDTGSGNVVVPSVYCQSCYQENKFKPGTSEVSKAIKNPYSDKGEMLMQRLTFGTGFVVGEFYEDIVCLGGCAV